MFFVNLIYGHFDILMLHYGQIKKSCASQVCAIVVLQLHTARTEEPITRNQLPLKHFWSPPFPWIPLRYPPNTPQTFPGKSRCQQTTTCTNRYLQAYSNSTWQCPRVSWVVSWCLLASVFVCWLLEFPGDVWGWVTDVWGVFMGIWVVFMEIYGDGMCLWGIWVLRPCNISSSLCVGTGILRWPFFVSLASSTLCASTEAHAGCWCGVFGADDPISPLKFLGLG